MRRESERRYVLVFQNLFVLMSTCERVCVELIWNTNTYLLTRKLIKLFTFGINKNFPLPCHGWYRKHYGMYKVHTYIYTWIYSNYNLQLFWHVVSSDNLRCTLSLSHFLFLYESRSLIPWKVPEWFSLVSARWRNCKMFLFLKHLYEYVCVGAQVFWLSYERASQRLAVILLSPLVRQLF